MFIFGSSYMGIVNNMKNIQKRLNKCAVMLSTGKRINSAADDPAGFAISEKMKAQIRGLRQASRNAQDGISLIQTAEGSMSEIHSMLQRMREISVQASNGTYTDTDRQKLDDEFQQLKKGINQIAKFTEFNTIGLLDGSKESEGIMLQVGANSGQSIEVKIGGCTIENFKLSDSAIGNVEGAEDAILKLDEAIKSVSFKRSSLGAMQNRLEYTISNLETMQMNLTAAESRISDADMAKTIMEYSQKQIQLQVAQAILAQAMRMEKERVMMLLESLK